MIMDIAEILEYLPHRYPFLLVDRVLEISATTIKALKNVTMNEPFFTGHFPGRPIMPGVLILEAMAQAAGILAYYSAGSKPGKNSVLYFVGVDNARFKKVVVPGDQLFLQIEMIKARKEFWKFNCTALVDNQTACYAEILAAKRD